MNQAITKTKIPKKPSSSKPSQKPKPKPKPKPATLKPVAAKPLGWPQQPTQKPTQKPVSSKPSQKPVSSKPSKPSKPAKKPGKLASTTLDAVIMPADVSPSTAKAQWSSDLASLARSAAIGMCPEDTFGSFGKANAPKSATKGVGYVAYHVVGAFAPATRYPSKATLGERARAAVQELLPRRASSLRKRFCGAYSELMYTENQQIGCGGAFCTGNYYTFVCLTDKKTPKPRLFC